MTSRIPKLSLAAALSILAAQTAVDASPLVSIGDSMSVYFKGDANAFYTSNLFWADDQVSSADDTEEELVLQFTPGVEFSLGRPGSDLRVTAYTGEKFKIYTDESDLNNELFDGRLAVMYDTPVVHLDVNLALSQNDSPLRDYSLGASNLGGFLVERTNASAGINTEYTISPKTSVTFGAKFNNMDYDSDLTANTLAPAVLKSTTADMLVGPGAAALTSSGLGNSYYTDLLNKYSNGVADVASLTPGAVLVSDVRKIRNDVESFTIPLAVYYKFRPKLDIGLGYRYRKTTVKDSLALAPTSVLTPSTLDINNFDGSYYSALGKKHVVIIDGNGDYDIVDASGTGTNGTVYDTWATAPAPATTAPVTTTVLAPYRQGIDTVDHFFSVNFRGEITPKLSGYLNIGMQNRQRVGTNVPANASGSTWNFALDSDLSYQWSPKQRITGSFSVDNNTSSLGQDTKRVNIDLQYRHSITPIWTFVGNVGAEFEEYENLSATLGNRKDDFYQAGFNIIYQPLNQGYYLTGGYTYMTNNSSTDGLGRSNLASFDNSMVSFGAGLKY